MQRPRISEFYLAPSSNPARSYRLRRGTRTRAHTFPQSFEAILETSREYPAGLPRTIPVATEERQCPSALEAERSGPPDHQNKIREIVNEGDHYDHAVGPIQQTPMTRYDLPPILGARHSLDHRTDQVAPGRAQSNDEGESQPGSEGELGWQCKLKEEHGRTRSQEITDEALPRLAWIDFRRDDVPPDQFSDCVLHDIAQGDAHSNQHDQTGPSQLLEQDQVADRPDQIQVTSAGE